MNLADAIRKASERSADEGGPQKSWTPTDLGSPSWSRAETAPEPIVGGVEALVDGLEEPALEGLKERCFPEPPTVTSGNVVRLELFLNSEQMTGLLKAILAGQHSVLTLKEAAAYLRVSTGSVQEMAEQGEMPGVLVNGAWRFPKSSLDEWMAMSAVKRLGSQLEDAEDVA